MAVTYSYQLQRIAELLLRAQPALVEEQATVYAHQREFDWFRCHAVCLIL